MLVAKQLVRCGKLPSLIPARQNFGNHLRQFASEGKSSGFSKTQGQTPTLMERLMAPTSGLPFKVGRGVVAGASVVALGSLCYYGAGLSEKKGTIDNQAYWPNYVRDRVKSTYAYFGGGLIFTAASAAAAARSPTVMNLFRSHPIAACLGTMACTIASSMVCRSIPYKEGFGAKQLSWAAFVSLIGFSLCPLSIVGGPILMRAAGYTAGIIGGLSTLAMCAPSDKFLYMGGPLAMGLGVVFISSLASVFVPATTVIGSGLYAVSLYGGLVLFGGFLLYDTQKVIHDAETKPSISENRFDPINMSMGIYLDTINIFVRVVQVLSRNGSRNK